MLQAAKRIGCTKGGSYMSYSDFTLKLLATTPVEHFPLWSIFVLGMGVIVVVGINNILSRKDF